MERRARGHDSGAGKPWLERKRGGTKGARLKFMAKKQWRVGLVGCGFMGREHASAYKKVNHFFELERQCVLQAVCARDGARAAAFAEQWGAASAENDWRRLVQRADIDAIDICAPNNSHAEIALAAAKAGKMVLC